MSTQLIRPPELSELEAFVLAVEEGSITQAAGRLRISPPAAAKRIRQLEVLARNPLLIRGHRGVKTTSMGERLYPIARELLAQRRHAVGALTGAPPADPLRIAGMHRLLGRAPAPPPEDLLRGTETVLAAIFHASGEAIIVTRAEDGMIHEVNEAAVRLLGYEQEELRGRTIAEVEPWEDPGRRDEYVQRAIASQRVQRATMVVRTRAGEPRWVGARFEVIHLRRSRHVLITLRELPRAAAAEHGRGTGAGGRVDEDTAHRFLDALRRGDVDAAEALAGQALELSGDLGLVHTQLFEVALRTIGELWEREEISVADEHLATEMSRQVAARVQRRMPKTGTGDDATVMMATVQGEQHAFGLRLASDVLEAAGYGVLYLGADVPLEALITACRTHCPDVLGIGATMRLNVATLIWEVSEITRLERPPRVMIGGRAATVAARQGVRAPVVEHSSQVLEVTRQLLGHPPARTLIPPTLAARMPVRLAAARAASLGPR